MMRKIYLFIIVLLASVSGSKAQTFSDNFDSYTANTFLGLNSTAWKTWKNAPGGADDIKISNSKAKSGSNSLFFSSTLSSGGPADIVLPFGAEYSTGTMVFSMSIFVDTQKKAYFNIQEQSTVGNGWSVDVNLDSTGNFNLVNTTSGILITGTYPQNQWIKVALNMNLSTNTWEFLINDISKGKFQNTYRKIASLDIFPIFNSSFYIDDVAYNYTPAPTNNLNAAVTYIDKLKGKLAGQITTPIVEVRNLGINTISKVNVEVNYNGNTISKTVSGLSLASNASTLITMNNPITLVAGSHDVTATVTLVNDSVDAFAADNSKIYTVNPVIPAAGKMVVTEEATGTWCSWCPRGAVWLKNMDENYPGLVLGIAVHNNDTMRDYSYDAAMKLRVSSYPNMLVDRLPGVDPSAMEPGFLQRIVIAPKGTIKAGATYNTSTGELKASLTTKFLSAVTGNYKIAFVLVEDSVTGVGSAFNQNNSYAGGSKGVMGGYELLPNPVPASKMVYDHVGRLIYPNFNGLSNAFAASVNANDSFTHCFTVMVNQTWKSDKLHIVGLLIDPTGKIDNGSKTSLSEAIANGYVNGTTVLSVNKISNNPMAVQVYPNPAKDIFNLNLSTEPKAGTLISIYNIEGKLIQSQSLNSSNTIIDAASWAPGVYFGSIQNENGTTQVKLVKE